MTRLRTDDLPAHVLALAPDRWGRITVARMNRVTCEAQLAFAAPCTTQTTNRNQYTTQHQRPGATPDLLWGAGGRNKC